MSSKRTKPFDLPTFLLAVGPLVVLSLLTAGWVRSTMAHKKFLDAARKGDTATLMRLLAAGADINTEDDSGWTALGYSANQRHYDAVKLLLEHGANVNSQGNGYLRTPLAMACSSPMGFANGSVPISTPNTRIIQLLLDHGADPKLDNRDPVPPLVLLAQDNDLADAHLLIDHGADIKVTVNGNSLLYEAVRVNNVALSRLLLDKGARADAVEPTTGETPLIRAVENENFAEVKLLLAHSVRTDNRDKFGVTALQWANKLHDAKMAALLKSAGAKK